MTARAIRATSGRALSRPLGPLNRGLVIHSRLREGVPTEAIGVANIKLTKNSERAAESQTKLREVEKSLARIDNILAVTWLFRHELPDQYRSGSDP